MERGAYLKFCFFQNISGLAALEVMPCGEKKTISSSCDEFIDNDKTCSHQVGISSV